MTIQAASKYTDVRAKAPSRGMQIIVPNRGDGLSWQAWWHKSLQPDGIVTRCLQRDREQNRKRLKQLAAKYHKRTANKSEYQLEMVLPGNLYFMLLRTDPDYFRDEESIRKLKRDTPEIESWKHA